MVIEFVEPAFVTLILFELVESIATFVTKFVNAPPDVKAAVESLVTEFVVVGIVTEEFFHLLLQHC